MFTRLSGDELWFLNHDVSDRNLTDSWVDNLDIERVVSLVARLEGRIIANAVLMRKRYGAKSHIGKIRVSVDPAFRGRRLATWMLLELINLAIWLGLRLLVMRLVQDRDFYIINEVKKLDFREQAVLEHYVMDREHNPHNLVIMTKRLPQEWEGVQDAPHL